jgi:hypothetical protein
MIAAKTFKTADRFAFDVVQNLKSLERTARATKRVRKLAMKTQRNRRAVANA